MLEGYDIIYFAPDTWEGLWRTRHQLMSMFARKNRVLFVEGRISLRKTMRGLRQGVLRLSDLRRPSVRKVMNNLFVFRYPLWAPISGHFPLRQLTASVRRQYLRYVLRKLGFSQPIVWLHRPSMVDLIDDIPSPRLLLYHVVDEYTTYGNVTPERHRRIEALEKEMAARVDGLIVVSKRLYESKRQPNPNTYLIPNGANFQVYSAALSDPWAPEELRAIPQPRLGYIGLISSKIDLEMLRDLAAAHPEWSLVFLGDARVANQLETWEALIALPNVHYLKQVKGTQVPYYVKGFDVGLMPYVQNRHADYISPMKLYDYLAAGVPVASLDFPAAREFGQHIHLARGPADFAQAVREALSDNSPERFRARRELAAQHSWEARIEQISEVIETLLASKGDGRR